MPKQDKPVTPARDERYDAQRIEQKWAERWLSDASLYAAEADSGKPIRPTWMEITVVFADSYPAAPAPLNFELEGSRPSKWTEGTLYPWGMFHGPHLRGVIRMDRCGKNGGSGTIEILRHDVLLHGKSDVQFALDPVSLDAAGQMSGF